ncbi:MAG: hypothetical protein J6U54_02025 [Clostridiales bacterium]|nr:hypothetical protein [Clostridiales bacterium]
MDDAIKQVLAKYDELSKLILDQKMDEMSDRMLDIPEDCDEMSYEAYLQHQVMDETEKQMAEMEDQEDDLLDGMSMREYFLGLSVDELLEVQAYCATELDGKEPKSLTDALVDKAEADEMIYQKLRDHAAQVIGEAAWIEEELKDENKMFEIEFTKVKACLELLIELRDGSLIAAILDRFLSYPETRDFVADSIAGYVEAFPEVSVPFIIDKLNNNSDSGLTGPFEDLVIILSRIGKNQPSEEIYQALKFSFRYMTNKIYAVICLMEYGDGRAIPMLKGYVNRNKHSIDRDLFYEIMSAVQNLGGDISDIEDPFGDFDGKKNIPGAANHNYRD